MFVKAQPLLAFSIIFLLSLPCSAQTVNVSNEKDRVAVECLVRIASLDGLSRAVLSNQSREEIQKKLIAQEAEIKDRKNRQNYRPDVAAKWLMHMFDQARASKDPLAFLKNYAATCTKHPEDVLGDNAFFIWKNIKTENDLP